jgi:hypothetical protein
MRVRFFLILSLLLITGCGNNDKSGSAPRDTLNVNLGNEPPSLDWSLATDSTSVNIINNIMEGLTKFGADFTPEPNLAESWQISEDGKTYTFKTGSGQMERCTAHRRGFRTFLEEDTEPETRHYAHSSTTWNAMNTIRAIKDAGKVGEGADDMTLSAAEKARRPLLQSPNTPQRKDAIEARPRDGAREHNAIHTLRRRHHDNIISRRTRVTGGRSPG